MKNKPYIIIGSIIIVLAIIAAGAFLIATKDVKPSTSSFDFDGTWRLFDSTATTVDEQYLVFEDGRVNFYKEKDKAYITSDFQYAGGLLELPEADVEFVMNIGTDNCLFLYGPNAEAYTLVRYTGEPFRFLYKGIIINHNKTEPTYTKTSLFLCEKRRFFVAWFWKGVVLISN